jgi:hypothetical protein
MLIPSLTVRRISLRGEHAVVHPPVRSTALAEDRRSQGFLCQVDGAQAALFGKNWTAGRRGSS